MGSGGWRVTGKAGLLAGKVESLEFNSVPDDEEMAVQDGRNFKHKTTHSMTLQYNLTSCTSRS